MTIVTDRLERKALQSVNAIQVANSWMLDYVQQVTIGRRVAIRRVLPAIDTSTFKPGGKQPISSDRYILCVGRLNDERKNLDLLLRAYAALPVAVQATTRLLLAGATAPSEMFWSRARQIGVLERVRFVDSPTTDELVALYQDASVFALSSNEEGFGVVIIEAMACGVPVVSTRSGGPDEIIQDSHDGFLVDVDDADGFADKLARLLLNPELGTVIGRAARHTVLARYDAQTAGRAVLSTYQDLLGGSHGASREA
jgi:glycosyltransferase involved in cell wall biosynthesis